MMKNWTVKPTVRYIPAVIAIGIALGVASHAIGFESGLVESVILHTITAFLIGSGLIFVVTNAEKVSPESSESIRSVIFGSFVYGDRRDSGRDRSGNPNGVL